MSTQEDTIHAKIRGLDERVTNIEAHMGINAGPTGAEVLAAKNAAKAARIAAEQKAEFKATHAAQEKEDAERKARKEAAAKASVNASKAAAKALAIVAVLLALCFNTQAAPGDTRDWANASGTNSMLMDGNLNVGGTLTVTGATTIVGAFTASAGITSTNLIGNGANVTNINAANIRAGTVLSAVNGNAVTNLNAANLLAGTVVSAVSGGSITNLDGGNIANGNIAEARLTNVLVSGSTAIPATRLGAGALIPANSGALLTNIPVTALSEGGLIPANSGASLTNINGEAISDDTIDDDSIDFADVTGADLTLTDVGALTTSGTTTLGGTTVSVTNNATVAGTLGVTGVSTLGDLVANDAAVDSLEDDSVAAAVAVTNAGSYQLEGLVVQLNSSGGVTATTNAITLLALDPTDEGAIFHVVNTGTNAISIAQTGTWAAPAIVIEEKAGATIVATASNVFYCTGLFAAP